MGYLALVGATVITSPQVDPIADAAILIEGDTVVWAGPRHAAVFPDGCEMLDCNAALIVAGFCNSHVHFFERKWMDAAAIPAGELARQLQAYTQFGFTTVFDLSSSFTNTSTIRQRIASGEVAGPSILTTGEGLIPPNSLPPDAVMRVLGTAPVAMPQIRDAAHAEAVATECLRAGADGIKVFASSQAGETIAAGTLEAAARVARAHGKPAFVHPNTASDVVAALQAGVDVIAHTTPRFGWDDEVPALVRARRPALTPTLTLWNFFLRHDRISAQASVRTRAIEQLSRWIDAGGRVLFGTDAGAVDTDPAQEYALMAHAGMDFADILASLTTAPAAHFGMQRCGAIAAGNYADLVVLDGKPELQTLTRVRHTLRRGQIVYDRTQGDHGANFSACNQL